MKYAITSDINYNFAKESYASLYPNLHKYPATMLPQIGLKLLQDFDATKGKLLDPYCGTGSSLASGLEYGISDMDGFDINPLAILIAKARFTKLSHDDIESTKKELRTQIFDFIKDENNLNTMTPPNVTNVEFWFPQNVITSLTILKHFVAKIKNPNLKHFFTLPLSETIRDCSYTRKSEFKLYKMKPEDILAFNPDAISFYFKKLNDTITLYVHNYLPRLQNNLNLNIQNAAFKPQKKHYDVVLTSPPYGDSRTTVAYGQFSTLSNEWLGIDYARRIDTMLMGGQKSKALYSDGIMLDSIKKVEQKDKKRALEVSSFYNDLATSISHVAQSVKKSGKIFYVLGNRTVKNITLPTDQFVAEKFEENGCKHITTIERSISKKRMPSRNSPTNKKGVTVSTMMSEYIVVCEKTN